MKPINLLFLLTIAGSLLATPFQTIAQHHEERTDLAEDGLVQMISFEKTQKEYALTALHGSKRIPNPPLYFAHVTMGEKSAEIHFSAYRNCPKTNSNAKLPERIIAVGGQKIAVYYFCAEAPNDNNRLKEIYKIKTVAGKEFVRNAFDRNKVVFVKFQDVEIPFDTAGFQDVWDANSGSAL